MWTPSDDTSDLFIPTQPYAGSFAPTIGETLRGEYVGFVLTYDEHEALILGALGCDYNSLFINQIPQYPMLGRIQDHYDDYRFTLEETMALRMECMAIAQICHHKPAFLTLRKLIYICDAAIEKGMGFWLMCD